MADQQMANTELLAKLKDVHMPAEPSWWPLAIGWWVLIALAILLIISILVHRHKKAQKYRLSKLAIAEVIAIEESAAGDWLMQLEVLLKRASLAHFPKHQVASLSQESWVKFLLSSGETIWTDNSLLLLKDAVYQQPKNISAENKSELFAQAKQWLHKIAEEVNRA